MKKRILSSDLLDRDDFEIRHVTPQINRKLLDEKPHRHPFHEIIYLKSGEGRHTIDGEVFTLEADTIYVIGEGQIHEFLEGINLKGYLLRYKLSVLPPALTMYATDYSILQVISASNSLHLSPQEAQAFDLCFEQLLQESSRHNRSDKSNHIFHFILLTLLSRINLKIRSLSNHLRDHYDSIDHNYKKLILLIEEHYKERHELPFYAKQLRMTTRQLSQLTESETGETAKQLVNKRLMIEARRLLTFTNMSFKEIAFDLGYKEPAYFSRLFKRKTGQSPKVFRQEIQG